MPKPIIFGCATTHLLPEEKAFFKKTQPLGFILFERNCATPDQVKNLVIQLKETVAHTDVPILIDQEGGRVRRLRGQGWYDSPPANHIKDEEQARENARRIGSDLRDLGITINCAPVVDVFHEAGHRIIGDRAFNDDPAHVARLALATILGFQDVGITACIKHLPGHGAAPCDSHEALPVVTLDKTTLEARDFQAFRMVCSAPDYPLATWGMTAHVVYDALEPGVPATCSAPIIQQTVRQHIGFKGFLISDDLSMKALSGPLVERAQQALTAGCDAVLHCSGDLAEMHQVAAF